MSPWCPPRLLAGSQRREGMPPVATLSIDAWIAPVHTPRSSQLPRNRGLKRPLRQRFPRSCDDRGGERAGYWGGGGAIGVGVSSISVVGGGGGRLVGGGGGAGSVVGAGGGVPVAGGGAVALDV